MSRKKAKKGHNNNSDEKRTCVSLLLRGVRSGRLLELSNLLSSLLQLLLQCCNFSFDFLARLDDVLQRLHFLFLNWKWK